MDMVKAAGQAAEPKMNEGIAVTRKFFEGLKETRTDKPKTAGLDQSEESIKRRHGAILDALKWDFPATIIDLGCGAGALLDSMRYDESTRPLALYTGVDFVDRHDEVSAAVQRTYGPLPWEFFKTAEIEEYPFQSAFRLNRRWDFVVATGVIGYPGLSSIKALKTFISYLREIASSGACTIPQQLPHDLGRPHLARFAKEDLQDIVPMMRRTDLGPELLLSW